MGLATLVFTALGVWQFQRLGWKLDLIARVDARIHADPEPAPGQALWAEITAANSEYKRVSLKGRYLAGPETLTMAVTELGPGYWVLAAFRTDEGFTVLVNRGFVPDAARTARDWQAVPASETQVVGMLRVSEPDGGFLRSNDLAADRWYSRDVAMIGQARGLGQIAPYFIDADRQSEPGPAPVGGLTQVHFRNTHLVYALTWLALALMSAGAVVYVLRHRRE